MLKKLVCTILIFSMLFIFCSCARDKYKPIASTNEEKTVVFKLGSFDVPYELFRTFFLTDRSIIDGGDKSVWLGSEAPEYREKATDLILAQICEIYAMFTLCEAYEIDIYSEEIEEEIKDMVALSVEGGSLHGTIVRGHGTYDTYIESLKKLYMNDSVARLMMRYSICEEKLSEKIEESSSHTTEDVYNFFRGDESAHISWFFRPSNSNAFTPDDDYELAESALAALENAESYDDVIKVLVQYSTGTDASDIENGFVIGKYTLDPKYMQEIIDAAFTLEPGEHSDIFQNSYGVYIVYKMEKDTAFLDDDKNYERTAEVYVNNELYKSLEKCKERLLENIKYTDFFNSLNFAEIEY